MHDRVWLQSCFHITIVPELLETMLQIPVNCLFETLLPARLFPPAQAVELVITDVVSPA